MRPDVPKKVSADMKTQKTEGSIQMKTVAVILAGGKSRRMGRDKALVHFDGETLLERTVNKYKSLFDEIYVSLNEPGRFPTYGALELIDEHPGAGPLAGLESAFLHTDADFVFLTATDLPFSDPSRVSDLVNGCIGYDVCLLTLDEPLYAVYARSCLPVIQDSLSHDMRKLRFILNRLRVNELGSATGNRDMLINVNDPAELSRAEKLLNEKK